jgi:outer membrane protein, heavy metal efflux system
MKKLIISIGIFCAINVQAQITVDSVLASVVNNNKTLQSGYQYWESQKLLYKTNLTPDNPEISFDYMIGTPNTAGNQIDFIATQAFDFPSVYVQQKNVSKLQIGQSDFQLSMLKQNVLLDAKLVCLDLIYLNKHNIDLKTRLSHAQKTYENYDAKFKIGEVNVIEFNKAKINLINAQSELKLNEGDIKSKLEELAGLNGGNPIAFTDTVYPAMPDLLPFDDFAKQYEAADPTLKTLQQQNLISQGQLKLSRSQWFPKLDAGFHYQAILGQRFSGFHLGMTIPLWQNINTIKQQKANVLFSETRLDEHQTDHYYELKQLYEQYLSLKTTYEDYKQLMATLNSTSMLEKALSIGQISSIEFFTELTNYYSTYATYLKIEKEYYTVLSQLNKYLL